MKTIKSTMTTYFLVPLFSTQFKYTLGLFRAIRTRQNDSLSL